MTVKTNLFITSILFAVACGTEVPEDEVATELGAAVNPNTAPRAQIDRFSAEAGTLMVRDDMNGLPEANAPISYDQEPFLTEGYGPDGRMVRYYNFDVQPASPAPIYVLFREGESAPVADQLNIVGVVPGDVGYSDFWQVVKVTVPTDYVANQATRFGDLSGWDSETTDTLVNCPVVPDGSTASMRGGDASPELVEGWYNGQVVSYFAFQEAPLTHMNGVPLSPIYVTFNINPDEEDGGPPSGFVTEDGSAQTHNVLASLPGDADYSPLWLVNIYDNTSFEDVSDVVSAEMAPILAAGAATVNCPVVDY